MGNSSFRYALLPDSLTAIGNRAFANNERLLFVNIPDNLAASAARIFSPRVWLPFSTKATMMQRNYCDQYGINWEYMP